MIIAKLYRYLVRRVQSLKSGIRVLHFRLLGIKIGKGCQIGSGVVLSGNITLGDFCSIGSNTFIGTVQDGKVKIADRCHIGKMSQIGSSGSVVTIGADCIFGPNIMITDAIHAFKEKSLVIKEAPLLTAPVEVGQNVWLGAGVMVMQGVTIGQGAVVGAKALVKKDIPPFSVAAGLPAKVLYFRE